MRERLFFEVPSSGGGDGAVQRFDRAAAAGRRGQGSSGSATRAASWPLLRNGSRRENAEEVGESRAWLGFTDNHPAWICAVMLIWYPVWVILDLHLNSCNEHVSIQQHPSYQPFSTTPSWLQ